MNHRPRQVRSGEEDFLLPKPRRKPEKRKSWNSTLAAPTKRIRPVAKGKHKTVAMKTHQDSVAGFPCSFCGADPPSIVHHINRLGEGRNHWRVIPACPHCHDVQANPDAIIHARSREAAEHEERVLRFILWELYGPDTDAYRRYLELAGRTP